MFGGIARSMRALGTHLTALLLCLALFGGLAVGQQSSVPNLVKFSGTIAGSPGGTMGALFALYADQTGGAPLWQEVQTITTDAGGHYTVLLGSTTAAGIPPDVFSSNQARWLGVQVQGLTDQPRVLLVSVPYAIKAADAETLGGLPASAFVRTDSTLTSTATSTTNSTTAPTANYVNSAAVTSAVVAAIVSTTGNIPMYTDGAGTLGASPMYASGGNVGIGTTAPATTLNLVGTNPSLRLDNYSNTVGDSPNFNFLSARGTSGAPLATQNNDNLGQFAAAGYNGSGFPGSKVKVTFLATEDWTPTANGTAMSFQTTANGTTARTERMRIDNTGNIGIGTPVPAYPLSVNGTIQSMSGGFRFPDGTTQATAAVSGVHALTSADSSIIVGGSASAPTVAVAPLGITDDKVHDVSVTKVAGAASTLASNSFSLPQTINVGTNGNVALTVEADGNGSSPNALVATTTSGDDGANAIYAAATNASSSASAIFAVTYGAGIPIFANATNNSAAVNAIEGDVASKSGVGVQGVAYSSSGNTVGIAGKILSPGGAAVLGSGVAETCSASTCTPIAGGVGGEFQTGSGGTLLLGEAVDANFNPTPVFRVDASGKGYFDGGTQTGGADFAESVGVRGNSTAYSPGDLLMVDPDHDRQFLLIAQPYSTLVAGIYATKPGVLATTHSQGDPRLSSEVPLAIVGIVPCKVSAENGPIRRGDLLVSSSTPGYAMRGTDRGRMLGAVVGKALGSLAHGTGTIEILVTLQ